jgi:predicted Zn-dependent protease
VIVELKPLEPPDSLHLKAADGWLELGNEVEANEELERIAPALRVHPIVLEMRWKVCAKSEKWDLAAEAARSMTAILPDVSWGWIHWAYSLHKLRHTKEAWEVLSTVADNFPEYTICYNLACYCCQLGQIVEAWQWLEKAIDLADKKDIRAMALADPDLKPLWNDIADMW